MSGYGKCPRCGAWSFEHLKSHSHCWECSFVSDELNQWKSTEFRKQKESNRNRRNEELFLCNALFVRGLA